MIQDTRLASLHKVANNFFSYELDTVNDFRQIFYKHNSDTTASWSTIVSSAVLRYSSSWSVLILRTRHVYALMTMGLP